MLVELIISKLVYETPLRRPDAPADTMSAIESTLFGVDRACWRG